MRRLFLPAALGLLALAACSPPAPAHDVGYYRDHAEDRARTVAACRADRSKAGEGDCRNARQADSEATSKAFWTVNKTVPRVQDPGHL